jgi:hypothetical protein
VQTPAWHVVPPEQMTPQAPQSKFVVCKSTQALAQLVVGIDASAPPSIGVHDAEQVPPLQTSFAAQAFPHALQLRGSLITSTQVPPQLTSPVGQTQLPPVHVKPTAHVLPHVPQLSGSLLS